MRAVWREFTLNRGAPFFVPVTLWDRGAPVLGGSGGLRRLNLVGVTGRFVARDGDDGPAVLELTTENGGHRTDGLGGSVILDWPADLTPQVPIGRFPCAWDLTSVSGLVVPLFRGLLNVPARPSAP